MLSVALHSLRLRKVTFAGSFVALSLGVCLLTVMGLALASAGDAPARGPERFAAAPVVVQGQDTLRVPTPAGVRTRPLTTPRPVPAHTVAALRKLGAVVEDRAFPVWAAGGPGDLVGHPWSTARFARYRLTSGRAPRTAREVVVTGDWARPGRTVRTDRGSVTVAGTLAARGFENAVFYPDARAARLSPSSTRLVVDAAPAAVRAALDDTEGVSVLTGDRRRLADPDQDREREQLTALNALFGTAGGVTGFVSVFVVASTFAFAVAQRGREFGLLRTAGATPGQLRRMVVTEALLVGVLACACGCLLGRYAAPPLAWWTVDTGLAPGWFSIGDHTWPYQMAFWTGMFVALLGVLAASWRAGRTGPVQALREASADSAVMTRGRCLLGAALLLCAGITLALALAGDPGDLLHRKSYIARPMLLITAVALLAPLVVRPLTRLTAWLPARLPGAVGMLVRENAAAGVRRTAAVAAPVLVTVALTGSLLGATGTLNAARTTEVRAQTGADFVVTPAAGTAFEPAAVHRLASVPGAEVSPTAASTVHVLEDGVALVTSQARAAEPGPLARTVALPVVAGRLAGLDDDSIVVNEEWRDHTVGDRVRVWLADGTRKSLRIAAVLATGTGDNGVLVTPANAPGARVDRVDVTLAHGAGRAEVAARLAAVAGPLGGHVRTGTQWIRASSPATDRTTRYGFLLVLGIALLYTGISVANTMVMATSDRARDLAVLRLAGATRRQVLTLVAAEALTVTVVGATLGLLTAAANLTGISSALALLGSWTPPHLPWPALAATTTTCATLTILSALVPAALAVRRAPSADVSARE